MTKTDNNISPFSEFRPITPDPYIQYSRLSIEWIPLSPTFPWLLHTHSLSLIKNHSDPRVLWLLSQNLHVYVVVFAPPSYLRLINATLLVMKPFWDFTKIKIEWKTKTLTPFSFFFTVLLYSHFFSFLIKPMQSNYYS